MRSAVRIVAGITGVLLAGAVLWGAAIVGYGHWAEDICLGDFDDRPAHGSHHTEVELVPPSFECHLSGRGVPDVVVQHRGAAILGATATTGPPIVTAIAVGAVPWWYYRGPRRHPGAHPIR